MIIYGRNIAKEYLENNNFIKKIYLQVGFSDKKIISLIENRKIQVQYLEKNKIDSLCSGLHQGILLDVSDYEYTSFTSFLNNNEEKVVVLATVMKTSVGTLNNVKVVQVTNLANTIDLLKSVGYWIVGTALTDNSVDYRDIDYDGKIALIIGNEGIGMSKLVTKKCDFIAKIPMYGKTNSLNASVAAGIMIYEMIRNRK